jgi:hypothetical protein
MYYCIVIHIIMSNDKEKKSTLTQSLLHETIRIGIVTIV